MIIQSDREIYIGEVKASGGVKLNSVRYVLGTSLALAVLAGILIWNIFAR